MPARRGPQGAARAAFSWRNARIVERIIHAVAAHQRVEVDRILGPARELEVCTARHLAMTVAFRAGLSYSEIGRRFGGRHHTSVMSAVEKVSTIAADDPALETLIEDFRQASAGSSTGEGGQKAASTRLN